MSFSADTNIANQWEDLTIYVGKDADLVITLTNPLTVTQANPNGLPYDLTGLSVNFVRKSNRYVSDATGITYTCSIQSPPTLGVASVSLPASDNMIPGVMWYRVDLVGTETKAVKFGKLNVYPV